MDNKLKPIDLFGITGIEKNLHDMMSIGMRPRVAFANPMPWVFRFYKWSKLLSILLAAVLTYKLFA